MSTPPDPAPAPSRGTELVAAWRRLDVAQRRVAAAATLVLLTLLLPWFSTDTVTQGPRGALTRTGGSTSGLGAFSFIEAAILIVAVGVLALTWGRATRRSFSLPAGDGTLACAAAGWIGLLVVYRLFAKPDGTTEAQINTEVDLSWGILATLVAAGLLLAAGLDQRRRGHAAPRPSSRRRAPDVGPVVDPATVVHPARATGTAPRADAPTQASAPAGPVDPADAETHQWPSRMTRPGVAPDGRPRAVSERSDAAESEPTKAAERPPAPRPAGPDDPTRHA